MFPQIFGKYVLERLIAVGGMARVFLATLRGAGGFEKKLVVKQIRAELATDEAFVRRFVAEAKTTVELSHPNIVPVYELGVEQGVYYLAMELCDGVTLAELVQKTGKLTPEEGAYVGIEICRALDYAHRKARIIHRDVTPRNVIVDEEGGIRLIDFGIAAPAFAGIKEVFGSPGHMPPEQLEGGELGPPTDVFAVAALLYEIWTEAAPFRRDTPEASEGALSEPVPVLSTIDPSFGPLDDLVASALSREPAARPQSAEELSRPLRRFAADADLGDLAKKLGARVARLKATISSAADPTDTTLGSPTPPGVPGRLSQGTTPERPSSPEVTRTFATRPLAQPADRSQSPNEGASAVATRRMKEDPAGWSTGDRRAARRRRLGTLGAGAALFVIAGASGVFLRRKLEEPRVTAVVTAPSTGAWEGDGSVNAIAGGGAGVGGEGKGAGGKGAEGEGGAGVAGMGRGDNAGLSHLRILANPQATVEIDGRPRGSSPIGDLVVAPGNHLVRLNCAPLGEAVSQNVRIEPGESITISGDFTGAHGRILTRRTGAAP